ncbi:MAG TPA: serine/threonine-protein kinase [Chloroflexota bacterium]|nr:serine/threonine-protein kinase [Chloroflexota bacterium]
MATTMEPRRIASYTLLEQIGYGGMAVVYRARQETLDRTVAVKILSENMAASPEFMERFRREARTAANLRHPNVITVHDFGEDERGVPYLVMEYIEGPTLADLMDAGLDDDRIPDLVDQIAAGLDYAHVRGVIHRDIKPGNVLMTEEGRAVLADFGLAWLLEGAQLTLTGGVIGTPEYMSPEQAAGHPFDHRADVYALGIVLYEMLVGERPFISETPIGMLLQHLQDTAPSVLIARPDLPAAVGDVLARALVKDPADRYSSAGELAKAFREAFAQRTQRGIEAPALAGSDEPVVRSELVVEAPAIMGIECAGCGERLPVGVGLCPACRYMTPLDQLPRGPSGRKLERRELVVNLLPQGIRWNPDGLQQARRLSVEALCKATVDGWEPTSIGKPYQLVEGRTISGSVVESTILTLERIV